MQCSTSSRAMSKTVRYLKPCSFKPYNALNTFLSTHFINENSLLLNSDFHKEFGQRHTSINFLQLDKDGLHFTS